MPGSKNGARPREVYEDRDARISILAAALADRPDTLTQSARIGLSKLLADGAGHTFFELFDLGRVLPEMARACRDMPEPEPPQQLANRTLVIGNVPAGQDQLPQVDTAPAHHPIALEVGTSFDQRRQLGLLLRAEPPRRPRRLAVDQPVRPRGIEAAHPVAQPLRVHRPEL